MATADHASARVKKRRLSSGRRGAGDSGGHRREGAGEEEEVNGNAAEQGGSASKEQEPSDDFEVIAAQSEGSMSELEIDVPDASGPGADGLDDEASDLTVLRKSLEELRRKRPRVLAQKKSKTEARVLTQIVRKAVETKDWSTVTASSFYLNISLVEKAVRQLTADEQLALIEACCERYESQPEERSDIFIWLVSAISCSYFSLAGHRDIREAMVPLLQVLARRRPPEGRTPEMLACLGRWRLVTELASLRGSSAAAAGPDDAAPPVAAGKPQAAAVKAAAVKEVAPAPESSTEDDEDDEDDEADGEADESA